MKRLRTMVLICFVLLFVCGCQKESGDNSSGFGNVAKKEKKQDLEGKYLVLESMGGVDSSADDYIDKLFQAYKDTYDKPKNANLDDYADIYAMGNMTGIVFSPENKFVIYPYSNSGKTVDTYTGEYRIIDNHIKFDYKSQVRYSGVPFLTLDKAPDEIIEYKDGDELFEKLKRLNTNADGSYPYYAGPRTYWCWSENLDYYFLYYIEDDRIPVPVGARYVGTLYDENYNSDWKKQYFVAVDDFLCTETTGMCLNGAYEPGKDFSISYDFTAVTDDNFKRSDILARDLRRGWPNDMTNGISTIHFTNNYWEWLDNEGDIIGKGTYTESQYYKGLIRYVSEEKKNSIFIYIDDNGQIWFPYMIKYND